MITGGLSMNKSAFRKLSYGVYLISSLDGDRPTGCIANSAMQITSDPASIAISINHDNFTNSCIERTGKFAISILSENTDPGIIGTFGFQSGKNVNKFDSVSYKTVEGLPVMPARISCARSSTKWRPTATQFSLERFWMPITWKMLRQ